MRAVFLFIIIITSLVAVYYSIKGGIMMLRFFMLLVIFQNIIVIVFSRFIPASYNALFSIIKEMMLYLSLVPHFIRHEGLKYSKKKSIYYFFLAIYILSLIKNLFITPAGLSSAVLSLRYMLVPLLCICVGKTVEITSRQKKQFLKEMVGWSLFLSIFGFIEMVVLNDKFWVALGYSDYAVRMKGNQPWTLMNGVTANYYTWDFFGVPLRRLVSITADPLATAFLVFLGSAILFTRVIPIKTKGRLNSKSITLLVLIVASVLSLSKAVFVMMIVTLIGCAYYYRWLPKRIMKIGIVLGGFLIAFLLYKYVSNMSRNSSILIHLAGLQNGLMNSEILGSGLGTAGSSVSMLTGADITVAESYIGSMIAQIGGVGTVGFFVLFCFQIQDLSRLRKKNRDPITILAICATVGVMICMLFSDSSVSIMGTGIYFIIIGMAQQKKSDRGGDEVIITETLFQRSFFGDGMDMESIFLEYGGWPFNKT